LLTFFFSLSDRRFWLDMTFNAADPSDRVWSERA